MTPREALRLVHKLAAAYPRQKIAKDTLQVYAEMMADMDFEVAGRACAELVATSKWFPSISEIRQRVVEAANDYTPAELAWAEVLKAVSRVGMYGQPTFDNPLTAQAVNAIGWKAICHSTTIGVERAHFIRAYSAAKDRAVFDGVTRPLLGSGQSQQPVLMSKRSGPTSLSGAVKQLVAVGDDE